MALVSRSLRCTVAMKSRMLCPRREQNASQSSSVDVMASAAPSFRIESANTEI